MSGGKGDDMRLRERAAAAALAELRGERTGILGATGETTLRSLVRAHRVPARWSVVEKLLLPELPAKVLNPETGPAPAAK